MGNIEESYKPFTISFGLVIFCRQETLMMNAAPNMNMMMPMMNPMMMGNGMPMMMACGGMMMNCGK